MKVLFIYEYRDARGCSRISLHFMRQMKPLCNFDELILLPDLKEKINKGYTSVDLQRDYKPDVVVCYANFAKEVFDNYFTGMSCAKTLVITDFHAHALWNNQGIMEKYRDNGFDIMFMRGVYDPNYKSTIPMVWVPFCANEKEFYPDPSVKRHNLIGFTGRKRASVYITRKKATTLLKGANLLRIGGNACFKASPLYSTFLRSHVACLTSTELYDWPPSPRAKSFEILGSGSVLLTPYFYGIEEMFGNDGEHYVKYDKSCSNVVGKAKWVINNPVEAKAIAENGHKVFLEKHTDSVRIRELYGHLVRLVEGKLIERRYGWEKN